MIQFPPKKARLCNSDRESEVPKSRGKFGSWWDSGLVWIYIQEALKMISHYEWQSAEISCSCTFPPDPCKRECQWDTRREMGGDLVSPSFFPSPLLNGWIISVSLTSQCSLVSLTGERRGKMKRLPRRQLSFSWKETSMTWWEVTLDYLDDGLG